MAQADNTGPNDPQRALMPLHAKCLVNRVQRLVIQLAGDGSDTHPREGTLLAELPWGSYGTSRSTYTMWPLLDKKRFMCYVPGRRNLI